MNRTVAAFCIVSFIAVPPVRSQDDVAGVPSLDRRAGGDEHKRYFLIGPADGTKPPKDGFKLLLVLPGGDGGAAFHPFVKRIFKNAVPPDYLVAQLVAVQWTPDQAKNLVWPTAKNRGKETEFTAEQFIDAVVKDVQAKHPIDARHVFTLSWSSSGPAAYAASLREDSPIRGSFVAMSVFRPQQLPPLDRAKGHAYYLYQSPEDKVCKFSFAEKARDQLSSNGANVSLVEYAGGHGWHGNVFGDIRRGIRWLDANAGKPASASTGKGKKPAAKSRKETAASDANAGENLIENGGFELGTDGWMILNNSGRAEVTIDAATKSRGKQSLRIAKTGGMPMDVVRLNLPTLPKGGRITVSARVKADKVRNAFFKFFLYDKDENSLAGDVDVARVTGTSGWKKVTKTFDVPPGAASGAVMFVMVLDGTVWIDEVRVAATP